MKKKYEFTIATCPGFESSQGARFPYIPGSMCMPEWYKCIRCGTDARVHDEMTADTSEHTSKPLSFLDKN